MAHDELLLYHTWMSSASRKVRFCLAEKELAFRSVIIDLLSNQQHSVEYRALNPNGLIPTLLHGELTLIESTVINEYLDEVFPSNPLRPPTPAGRARMRVWTKYVDEVLIRAFQVASWNRIIRPAAMDWSDEELAEKLARIPTPSRREDWRRMAREPFTEGEITAALAEIRDALRRLEQSLQVDQWLAGAAFSLADISMAPYVVRLNEFAAQGLSLERFPALRRWWERVQARPAFAVARIVPLL